MSEQNDSALALATNSAFSACPHCGARKYRRLDDGGGDQDSHFFLSLSLWGLLPWVPFFLIGAWNPDGATLVRLSADHPMLFGALKAYLRLGSWSALQVWGWICVAILSAASYGAPRFFAGCTACCNGSFSDPVKYPLFSEKQFPPKSIPSRIVVAVLRLANLRLIPWLEFCSVITWRFWFFCVLGWLLYVVIYRYPFLVICPGALYIFFKCVAIFKKVVPATVAASVVTGSFYLAIKVWPGFLTVPFLTWLVWRSLKDNRKTQFTNFRFATFAKALRSTLWRIPLLLLVMIPGLTLKAGFDWACFGALDALENRTAMVESVSVPTFQAEQYPWSSPLYWLGVPRYRVIQTEVSLKKPQENVFTAIGAVRSFLSFLELLVVAFLALLFCRVLVSMFLRELLVNGVRLNSYLPNWNRMPNPILQEERVPTQGDGAPISSCARSESLSMHATLQLDKSWAHEVFLKRDLSPTGGVPSTELPAPKMAFVGRLIHRCLIMDRYDLSQQTIRLDSTDGHRFVRWHLGANDIVCISFNRLVGWTGNIKLGTAVCLQVGMLAQGKILVHPVSGPGSLIFDLHGELGEHTKAEGVVFQPDRLVGFRLDAERGDAHPSFSMDATGGTLNALLGNIALRASPGSQLLLDPKGRDQRFSHPVIDLLRHSYSILG